MRMCVDLDFGIGLAVKGGFDICNGHKLALGIVSDKERIVFTKSVCLFNRGCRVAEPGRTADCKQCALAYYDITCYSRIG